jgi:hypothetical protein
MPELESDCQFRSTCYFFNIKTMIPSNKRLKEIYCIERPQKYAIYQVMAAGRPVSITLWPTGKIQV